MFNKFKIGSYVCNKEDKEITDPAIIVDKTNKILRKEND